MHKYYNVEDWKQFALENPGFSPYSLLEPQQRYSVLAEFEARARLDGVEQFLPQEGFLLELGELQEVHAGARGGETDLGSPVLDAKGGLHVSESEERRFRTARDKLEEQAPFVLVHGGHRPPEHLEKDQMPILIDLQCSGYF